MPALNMAAVLAESRVSPLDGGNMNRAFPGGADAGPTRGVAGFVTAHLLPGGGGPLPRAHMFGGRPKARALVEEDARHGAAVLLPDPSRARRPPHRPHTHRPHLGH